MKNQGIKIYGNGNVSEYSTEQLTEMARQMAKEYGSRVTGWHIEVTDSGRVRLEVTLVGGGVGVIL